MDNFGQIKQAYNLLLAESISVNDSKGKLEFKKYLKTIKENKVLKSQFDIYYTIENAVESDPSKAMTYVNECLSLIDSYSKDDIISTNLKLSESIKSSEFVDDSKSNLYESIHLLLTTKKNVSNISSIVEAKHNIVNYILNNKKNCVVSEGYGLPNSVLSEIAVEKFNEEYAGLDESIKSVISIVLSKDNSEKELFYNGIVKECIDLVNLKLVESTGDIKEKLLSTKENLLNREFNNESFIIDVTKVLELKDFLN
jgi:hypothetical protein